MKRPFLLPGLIGMIALVFASLISAPLKNHSFHCQPPFTLPMLGLEFIGSTEALQAFFGTEGRPARMEAMESALGRDFLFILAYSFYLIAFAHTIFRQRQKRRYLLLALLAACIGLADIFENGSIKMLMEQLQKQPGAEVQAVDFHRLHFFTWTKWLGLVVYFAATIPFLRRAGRLGQFLAFAALGVSLLGLTAVFNQNWIERYALSVFLLFPLTVLFCFLQRNPNYP